MQDGGCILSKAENKITFWKKDYLDLLGFGRFQETGRLYREGIAGRRQFAASLFDDFRATQDPDERRALQERARRLITPTTEQRRVANISDAIQLHAGRLPSPEPIPGLEDTFINRYRRLNARAFTVGGRLAPRFASPLGIGGTAGAALGLGHNPIKYPRLF